MKKMMKMISKEQFDAYERVRRSGKTNMLNVTEVMKYSRLKRNVIMEIMVNYSNLKEVYGDGVNKK